MKLLVLILFFFSCSDNQESKTHELEKNKTEENGDIRITTDSVELNSYTEIALGVVDFLINKDTSKYLQLAIPFSEQKHLFKQNFEYRPDIKDTLQFLNELESNFDDRMANFLVRSGYIQEIMLEDKKFEIQKATIDSIYFEKVRIKNYGGFNNYIVGEWADVTIKFNYNGKPFYFEIPQIIKVRNKWHLYYPEYYLRDQNDLDFIEKRIKQINEKAKDFWK